MCEKNKKERKKKRTISKLMKYFETVYILINIFSLLLKDLLYINIYCWYCKYKTHKAYITLTILFFIIKIC